MTDRPEKVAAERIDAVVFEWMKRIVPLQNYDESGRKEFRDTLEQIIREAYAQGPAVEAEKLAQRFHEAYERLAPQFGYETRRESAKPWSEVPEQNRKLMIAVCSEILAYARQAAPQFHGPAAAGESVGTASSGYLRYLDTVAAQPTAEGPNCPICEAQREKRMDVLLDENCIATIKRLTPEGGEEISFGGTMGGIRLLWREE